MDDRTTPRERQPRRWPYNKDVAKLLGVSHSAVSKFRSGTICPSYATMLRIEQVYGWPWTEQQEIKVKGSDAAGYPDYAEAFESKLQACHPKLPPLQRRTA